MNLPKNINIVELTFLKECEDGVVRKFTLLLNRPAKDGEYSITITGVIRMVKPNQNILWMDGRPTIKGSENGEWKFSTEIIK